MSRRPIILPPPAAGQPMLPPPAREPGTEISNMNLTNRYPFVPVAERPQPSGQQIFGRWLGTHKPYDDMLRKTGIDQEFFADMGGFPYSNFWYSRHDQSRLSGGPWSKEDGTGKWDITLGTGPQKLVSGYGATEGMIYPQGLEECKYFKFKQGDLNWRQGKACIPMGWRQVGGVRTYASAQTVLEARSNNN